MATKPQKLVKPTLQQDVERRHGQSMVAFDELTLATRESTRLNIEANEEFNKNTVRQMAHFHNMHANVMTSLIRTMNNIYNALFWMCNVIAFGVAWYIISKIFSI